MRLRRLPVLLLASLVLWSAPAGARSFTLQGLAAKLGIGRPGQLQPRFRGGLIRSCLQTHRTLLDAHKPLPLPESGVLGSEVARAKTYAASWTCRESTRLLLSSLDAGLNGRRLVLDSSGKNAFRWGNEGWVSFHYYAVDDPRRPTLLVDPTASSNFRMDVQPGGLLRTLLTEAARDLGQPSSAVERIARRIDRGGSNGLLVLANPAEIDLYREALERAARLRKAATRDAERSH
jgi:hypothetical protein